MASLGYVVSAETPRRIDSCEQTMNYAPAHDAFCSATLSVIVPYYNESNYIAKTLKSLCNQNTRNFAIILVDNASTDDSEEIARAAMAKYPDIAVLYLHQPIPGKIHALDLGLSHVVTDFVATCDADTLYPEHYVATCLEMLSAPDVVAAMAINLLTDARIAESRKRISKVLRKSVLFRSQCHAGGYAQAFRTSALRAAGGFSSPDWPFVLEDHEVVNRVLKRGKIAYREDHYCFPSERRTDRRAVSWTWDERMVYRFTPGRLKDWFFYDFLAKRFERRGLVQTKLRERDF